MIMFGTKHIILLISCVLLIVAALILLYRKKPRMKTVLSVLLGVGIFSETVKVVTYILMNEEEYGGYLPKTDLPFHLCSIQIIFVLILVLSDNQKLRRVLYAFMLPTCLIGGVAAILIPTSSSLSNTAIMIQYFSYHSALVIFAIYLYMSDEIKFEAKDYVSALLMLYGCFFAAIYLNSWVNDYIHNINFMYVVKPPMDGLPFLNKNNGWLSYILRYAALAVVCVTGCYIVPISARIKSLVGRREKCK